MVSQQSDTALKDAILKAASGWLAEKQSPFAVAEEFVMYVTQSSKNVPPPELLAAILSCGFPCVRGDKGERVLWLGPTKKGSSTCPSFLPTEAVRWFAAALRTGEAKAA